ncbi:MAG: SHOCT-like domain-containing protein [Terriglobales bacterium]
MSAESRKVLEMLAEGKITAEEADKLLEKLSSQPSAEAKPEESSSSSGGSSKPRFLRIAIDKPGEKQVNVRIPLAFARSGSHLLAVLPTRVREKLAEQGIDLSATAAMDATKWENLVADAAVDIDKGNGKKVKIFCE